MDARLTSLLRSTERYTKTDMVYLFTAGFWSNLNIIIMSALGLLLSVAFANLLEPAVYGEYQYLLSLSVLVAALSLAGMNSAVAQAVARGYEGTLGAAVRTQLRWMGVPILLSALIATYYFIQGNTVVGIGLVAIALLTPLSNVFNTYVGLMEGRRDFRHGFLLASIINVVSYGSLFLALLWIRNAPTLILVNLASNALAAGYAYYRTMTVYTPNDRVDPEALRYGKHLSVLSGFTTVMAQLDAVLVFHFLGAAELAVYSLATMLPERAGTFFTFIGIASMPKFASQPIERIRRHLPGKIIRIAIAGAVAALAYALFAPFFFALLFPKYLSAVPFSQAYAPVIALVALTSIANVTLKAKRLTKEIYAVGLIQPILLVGLQIPLLIAYGIWGMIAARLISDTLGICLTLFLTYRPLSATPEEQAV